MVTKPKDLLGQELNINDRVCISAINNSSSAVMIVGTIVKIVEKEYHMPGQSAPQYSHVISVQNEVRSDDWPGIFSKIGTVIGYGSTNKMIKIP